MGLAYASLNDHHRARDCYKKAVELDPANESYRSNLSIAEEKVTELERQDPLSALAGGLGNFDLGSVLQNPALMQMASQVMSDPAMQNLMTNLMGGIGMPPPSAAPSAAAGAPTAATSTNTTSSSTSESASTAQSSSSSGGGPGSATDATAAGLPTGLDGLLRAGQAFAQRMQETNPDLINQLRNQMPRPPGSDQQPPPSS